MKLPSGVDIQVYKRIMDMPVHVRAAVRMMGSRHEYGHMRGLASGSPDYRLVTAAVLMVDGKPVGWTTYYYHDDGWECCPLDRCVSVWVKKSERGKGYGRILTDYAYNRWSRYTPMTYASVETKWNAKDRGDDDTHRHPATLK